MTLGEKLTQYRKKNNLTQDAVAELLGVTPQAVSKWENDASCPDIMLLPQIATLYETTADELLSREAQPIVALAPESARKAPEEMVFHILADSADGDHVKLNLPLPLVKAVLQAGAANCELKFGSFNMSGIDFDQLIRMAENGAFGRLVEVDSADGDHVVVEVC